MHDEHLFFKERTKVVAVVIAMTGDGWQEAYAASFDWLALTIGSYQEQPVLLQSALHDIISPISDRLLALAASATAAGDWAQFHMLCKVIQLFCRVRGYKHVMKLFPHEVFHLEMCLSLLRAQSSADHDTWETRYVLLLWLCVLCLIPFDICSMDSTMTNATTSEQAVQDRTDKASTLVQEIVDMGKGYLSDPGPTRDASCACLSSLLTRPDMETQVLGGFFVWSSAVMDAWTRKGDSAAAELTATSFQVIGVLQTMAQIFKKGDRNRLLAPASEFLPRCIMISAQQNQVLTRKLTTKLIQRVGMTFLPPRVAAWRYQRGKRSLMENLTKSMDSAGSAAAGSSSSSSGSSGAVASSSSSSSSSAANEEVPGDDDDEDVDVSTEVEDVLDRVLESLSDKDTVVRSASFFWHLRVCNFSLCFIHPRRFSPGGRQRRAWAASACGCRCRTPTTSSMLC
jgi:hypothetical protein